MVTASTASFPWGWFIDDLLDWDNACNGRASIIFFWYQGPGRSPGYGHGAWHLAWFTSRFSLDERIQSLSTERPGDQQQGK
ncbi:hypothetical protein EMIT0P265_10291 [Pseudomonas zeae]